MTAAYNTFISIPELVACLTPLITRHDLIKLARINRTFHAICTPLLWHTLDLEDESLLSRLLASPHGLRAIGTHAHLICAVAWRPNFSWYYFRALWVYLNSTFPLPLEHKAISTTILAHGQWGNLEYSPVSFLVPLPPLLGLSRFKACMTSYHSDRLIHTVPTSNLDNHLHQILWLVRLNGATLTHLNITKLSLICVRVVRDISRTISQLPCLRVLQLEAQPENSLIRHAFECLFYSCPASLVDLKVSCSASLIDPKIACLISGDTIQFSRDPVVGDWDYDQGPLVLRDTYLLHLKSLDISMMPLLDLAEVCGTVLGQCPALESLALPKLGQLTDDMLFVIASISELCPRISSLSFPEGCLAEHVTMVLESLPEQQLRNLCYCSYNDPDPEPIIATWTRHSTTLRRIEFTYTARILSSVIQAALTTCEGLEVLNVTCRTGSERVCLIFANAIESEWVCKRIRELVMNVWITSSGRNPSYMEDPTKATWTEENRRHWEDLGKFYSQIGSLSHLEILDLQAVGKADTSSAYNTPREVFLSPTETCLPGLLALEDAEKGKIGYLGKLVGLTRLRELRGSMVWTQRDNLAMIGEKEVDWFVNHLPSLEMATFEKMFSRLLYALQVRRPSLRLRHN
ncbi:hypothetical protein BGZ88_002134 [Linnemannia elongata]|nr:hypothetical protein BGZ88_002134 [Linnemannia elongata]